MELTILFSYCGRRVNKDTNILPNTNPHSKLHTTTIMILLKILPPSILTIQKRKNKLGIKNTLSTDNDKCIDRQARTVAMRRDSATASLFSFSFSVSVAALSTFSNAAINISRNSTIAFLAVSSAARGTMNSGIMANRSIWTVCALLQSRMPVVMYSPSKSTLPWWKVHMAQWKWPVNIFLSDYRD